LPSKIGPSDNLLWKTELPSGHSSPVIAGDRLFLTGFEGDKLFTIAMNTVTGKEAWRQEAPRDRTTKIRAKNTPASPSPVTDGKSVFVYFEDYGLLAYSRDGKLLWKYPLPAIMTPYGPGSSPVLADGLVILDVDQDKGSFLLAVDAKNGKQRWRTERPEATHGFATPVIYRPSKGKPEIIVSGSFRVDSYSLASGERLWWVEGMAWQAKSTPVIAGDRLYVHSWMAAPSELGVKEILPYEEMIKLWDKNGDGKLAVAESQDKELAAVWFLWDLDRDKLVDEKEWNNLRARNTAKNGLYAIRLGGARGNVTDTHVLWRYDKSLPNIPSPILYQNVLYVLREGGILTALNPEDGSVLKQGRVEGAPGGYFASLVAGDGKLYAASQEGKVAVLKAGADWEVLATTDLGDEIWSTPAIAGGRVFVRTQKAVYCFGMPRG
jgi:outer membrane protein assembly factor BamB